MHVTRVRPPTAQRGQRSQPVPSAQQDASDTVPAPRGGVKAGLKKTVIASALASGGLTAGYFLGGMGGGMLTNATGVGTYAQYGATAGAALGALWGAGAYLRNDDHAISAMITGSAAATLGGAVGLFAGAQLGPLLGSLTGHAAYATSGPLAAAVSGGLAAFALTRRGADDKISDITKQAAGLALGGTIGWMAGGAAAYGVSLLGAPIGTLPPVLGGVTGGLIGLALYLNGEQLAEKLLRPFT